jgi:hypothetical protein
MKECFLNSILLYIQSEDTLRMPNNRARYSGLGRSFWGWGRADAVEDHGYLTPLTLAEDRSHYLELIDSKGGGSGMAGRADGRQSAHRGSIVSSLLQRYDSIASPSSGSDGDDEAKRSGGRPWVRPSPAGAQLLARWQHEHSHQVFCNCGLGHCPLSPANQPHGSSSPQGSEGSGQLEHRQAAAHVLSEDSSGMLRAVGRSLSEEEEEEDRWKAHTSCQHRHVSESEDHSSSSSSGIGLRPLLSRDNNISADLLFTSAESNI